MLSQINKHEEALEHGKTAALYCQDLIKNTELLCKDYLDRLGASGQKENLKKKYLSSPAQKRSVKGKCSSPFVGTKKQVVRKDDDQLRRDDIKQKLDKLHKFEAKEK